MDGVWVVSFQNSALRGGEFFYSIGMHRNGEMKHALLSEMICDAVMYLLPGGSCQRP